jgi:serine phosphatase RsbU (regulator of sigma subunit)
MDAAMSDEETGPRRTTLAPSESAWDILEIITSGSADGITIQHANGTLIYANDAAARMCGFASGQEMQQAPIEQILERFVGLGEGGLPLPIEDLPGRRAMRGEPEPEAIVRFRRCGGEDDRWALVRATPLFDDARRVRHVVNVFVDITADRQRTQAQTFLAEASKALWHSSLEWKTTLQNVAQLPVPTMADWCAVDVVEPDGSIAPIAVAHVDPEKVDRVYELRRMFPPRPGDNSGAANVIRTGRAELIPEATQMMSGSATISDPAILEALELLQPSSIMYVPLIARTRTLGALTMAWAESDKRYTEDDLRVAEELAGRAAFAIDNARLYADRDHIARSLQERLLPKSLPDVPGIDIAARYVPAGDFMQAGGDFYDLFEMDDGSWKAVIGDVCGKGPEAAALMGFVRFTMRAVSRQDRKPSEALVKLNRALLEELGESGAEFCTAAVVRIRPHEGGASLTVAVAGHPLPIIIRANGTLEEVGAPGMLLGIVEDVDVSDVVVDLHRGDAVVMLTDGVMEASIASDWTTHTIPGCLRRCAGMSADSIADRIEAAVEGVQDRRTDDIALLVIQCRT